MGALKDSQISAQVDQLANIELGDSIVKVRARGKFRDSDAKDFVPTPESALLYIDTPNYDGPLDLLLHLIRKHSMDIFDIPIVLITKKYLSALDEMRALNLDLAGEFLVMAATLAHIKSRMLLPKDEQSTEAEEEDDGIDPRQALIQKLLVYKSFKEAGAELLKRPVLGHETFFRDFSDDEEDDVNENLAPKAEVVLAPLEIFELLEKLSKALSRNENISIHTISRDRISVSARINELMDFCQVRQDFSFHDALKFFPIYERIDVIVTFLALLEMSRLKLLRIQNSEKEDLRLNIVKENFYTEQNKSITSIEEMGEEESQWE